MKSISLLLFAFVLFVGCGSETTYTQIENLLIDIDNDGQDDSIVLKLEEGVDSLDFTRVTINMSNGNTASFDNPDGWGKYSTYDEKYTFEKDNLLSSKLAYSHVGYFFNRHQTLQCNCKKKIESFQRKRLIILPFCLKIPRSG
ncbi:MAG: hypothetical protein GY816_06535 [Cytophagales bacterium]|nr:hypothetical protein [Cytophagales bacterium]